MRHDSVLSGSPPIDPMNDPQRCSVRPTPEPRPEQAPPLPPPPGMEQPPYPYDAWVLAGGRLFRAHARVLEAHSPYLRASISALGEARLLLPHIPSGGFGAILSYMYTGRLSLAHAPLYEIVVAGHLLQMPGLVALCQTILASSSLLNGSNRDLFLGPAGHEPATTTDEALSTWQSLARLMPPSAPSTSATHLPTTLVRPTPTRPFRPRALHHTHSDRAPLPPRASASPPPLAGVFNPNPFGPRQRHGSSEEDDDNSNSAICSNPSPVVIDVAACDGPVFFERVVNKAFRSPNTGADPENTSDSEDSEINVVDTGTAESSLLRPFLPNFKTQDQVPSPYPGPGARIYHCVYCNSNFKSHYCYQKHMRRHINPITVEETEVVPDSASHKLSAPLAPAEATLLSRGKGNPPITSEAPSGEESHPTTTTRSEVGGTSPSTPATTTQTPKSVSEKEGRAPSGSGSVASGSSGEEGGGGGCPTPGAQKLRVLDLNVQYFPCKTCGSKFPSYYFVHKHRRMCHTDEDDPLPGGRGDKRKTHTPNTHSHSSSSSSSSFSTLDSTANKLPQNQ